MLWRLGPSPEKVYEEDEVAGNEMGEVSMLKVNCIRLIMPLSREGV
jgi:hypothetical protein